MLRVTFCFAKKRKKPGRIHGYGSTRVVAPAMWWLILFAVDAPKCSVSVFEVIRGVVADGICLMAIKIPHDGSPAYGAVG